MRFDPPLREASLIKRYKRFLTDVRMQDGSVETIHCPNTGSMKNCCPDNAKVWFSTSDNPKRKYPFTWEVLQNHEGEFIGINTHRANVLVEEALRSGKIAGLKQFEQLDREVRYGSEGSRIDFLLTRKNKADVYVEVKSVTLKEEDGWGYFPDAVSERGQKHLRELIAMRKQGHEAVLLFCVQHSGISKMKAARHIDPEYADLLEQARRDGVRILAYGSHFSIDGECDEIELATKVRLSI